MIDQRWFGQIPNPVSGIQSHLLSGLALLSHSISPSSLAYIHGPTLTSLLSVPPCHRLHLCVFASMESHV